MDSMELAKRIRIHVVKMAHYAHESHVASSLSAADIVAVLYSDVLNISSHDPKNEMRDRFVLSKGHACSAVYAALAEKGFFPLEELYQQCQNGARLSGHITSHGVPGVELSTGSLGHGCCVACGMAFHAKNNELPYRVFVLMGDGECNEGSVWEMAQFAAHNKLNNFTVVVDNNSMQAMGMCKDVLDPICLEKKWQSFGWQTVSVDGHNHLELLDAFSNDDLEKPECIIARTVKGKGVSFMENNILWHYRDPQGEAYERALAELECR